VTLSQRFAAARGVRGSRYDHECPIAMNEGTLLEASVPAPVDLDANDFDLEAMRADFRQHCHGVYRPWFFGLGILYVALGVFDVVDHRAIWWSWGLFGLLLIAVSLRPDAKIPSAERSTVLQFSESGLDVDVAFQRTPSRHYSWRGIRAINDIGEHFVLVPVFGKRLVFPKRSFPDGGHEAWAFFAAHGVAGRTPRKEQPHSI
jgi:hypothetical protein